MTTRQTYGPVRQVPHLWPLGQTAASYQNHSATYYEGLCFIPLSGQDSPPEAKRRRDRGL